MHKTSVRIWIVAGLLANGGISTLHAYDIHHPNPMAILRGVHHHRAPRRPIIHPRDTKRDAAKSRIQPWRMFKRRKEGKYVIKPEPYSLTSHKSDPELLGPQQTLGSTVESNTTNRASSTAVVATKPTKGVTREECIGWIGQERYDAYVTKYGGEKGALRRCLILKRTRG